MTNKVHISQQDDRTLLQEDGSTLLTASAVLYGEVVQVSGYSHITGFTFSDVDSASNGIIIEQGLLASDFPAAAVATVGVTISSISYSASDISSNSFSVQIVAPLVRIIYINGGTDQATFRLAFEARIFRGL